MHRRLHAFAAAHSLGVVLPHATSFQIWPDHPMRYRKPDGAFIPRGLLPDDVIPDGHIHAVPRLVIEVISRHDVARLLEEKVLEYFAAGVAVVWMVHPETQTILIRRADGTAAWLGPDDTLTGEDFLPGFQVKVREIFA
jgi:Uma2 family endonuclease